MQEFYEGIELTDEQTEWLCRGLLDLAAVDGLHENEIALIADFYTGGAEDAGAADLEALRGTPFDLKKAREVLAVGGDKLIDAFLVSGYLLIYADGEHSDEERQRVREFAEAFGVADDRLESLHLKARLYLLQMLANNLRNKDAVRQVGTDMGLGADDIASALED